MKRIWGLLAVLVMLMSLKWFYYYDMVQMTEGSILTVTITVLFTLWAFFAVEKLKWRKGSWLFIGAYVLFSVVFLIDVVYFKQFNTRATVKLFQNIGVVGDIGDSVLRILRPIHFIALIDLPFWVIFAVQLHKNDKRFDLKWRWLIILPVLVVTLMVVQPLKSNYTEKVGAREFFTFHLDDIVNQITNRSDTLPMDNLKVLSQVNEKNKIYQDADALSKLKLNAIAKGKNLIVVQIESFQNFVIDKTYNGQELTPFLNTLLNTDTLYFDNYYQQLGMGNTSDAEFSTNNSIYPTVYGQSYALYMENTFRGLPWQLRDQGYRALAFHGYKPDFWSRDLAYPGQGFERFYSENDFTINEPIGFGLNDFEFFDQSIAYLKTYEQPFYGFLITLSNHHPYQLPLDKREIILNPEHQGTLFGDYLQSVRYTDNALKHLFEQLKAAGLYENSVIALYGDHHGLVISDLESKKILDEFLGKPYEFDEMVHIPLLIHIPNSGLAERISTIGTQVDFLPTIMNLLGIPNDNLLIFGQDLVNTSKGVAAFQAYAPYGSFISDRYVFEMSKDFIFNNARAWDRITGSPVDINLCYNQYNQIKAEFDQSKFILDNNLLVNATQYYGHLAGLTPAEVPEQLEQTVISVGGKDINGIQASQSKESLDEAYKSGDRLLALNFSWTEDESIVAMLNWSNFASLTKAPTKAFTREAFLQAELKEGLTPMDLTRTLDWLSRHKDARIIAFADQRSIEFSKFLFDNYQEALRRFVIVVDTFEKFHRLAYLEVDKIVIDADALMNSPVELEQFVEQNLVYMVITSDNRMSVEKKNAIALMTNLYIRQGNTLVKYTPEP